MEIQKEGHPGDLSEARWRRSSRSGHNGQCVEVAALSDELFVVRDSKNPTGPVLAFTRGEWDAFLAGVGGSEFTAEALLAP